MLVAQTIAGIFARITSLLNLLIPFLLLLATVIFLYGVVKYVASGGDEKKVEEARKMIMYGVVALAAMLAVWGFVGVIVGAIFGFGPVPSIPGIDLEPFN
jgi:fumarate reductase subunit D